MIILISTPAVSGLSGVLRDLPAQRIVEETVIVGAIKHPGAHVKFDQGVDLVGYYSSPLNSDSIFCRICELIYAVLK